MNIFYLVGILVFLFIALRLVNSKRSKDLNHRKTFQLKSKKTKQKPSEK
jgi:hypothetical protein